MKNFNNTTGSILIWTTLLGIILTSTFFFFAVRLNANTAIQRNSIIHQNQKAYLKSYADYLETLTEIELSNIVLPGDIKGSITNQTNEITGVLDSGEDITYNFVGDINIDWNLCSNNQKGDILIDGTEYLHDTAECGIEVEGYDDITSAPVTVINPFTITAPNAPIQYKITAGAGTQLLDNKWTINFSVDTEYGKKIEIKKVFMPQA